MPEIIKFPFSERKITPLEAGNTIVFTAKRVSDAAKSKSHELKDEYGSRNSVKRQSKKLLQKADIISAGIPEDAVEAALAHFLDYLEEHTSIFNESLVIAFDNDMLAGMVDKYTESIQVNMIDNGLLTEEAKQALAEIKVDFTADLEQ